MRNSLSSLIVREYAQCAHTTIYLRISGQNWMRESPKLSSKPIRSVYGGQFANQFVIKFDVKMLIPFNCGFDNGPRLAIDRLENTKYDSMKDWIIPSSSQRARAHVNVCGLCCAITHKLTTHDK